jgi:quercetin dioxygenase-like cupin family protein
MNLSELNDQLQGQIQCDLGIVHHFSDGLYAKQMMIPKGFLAGMHAHTYGHLSILAKGKVIVRTDFEEKEYSAPACIEIKSSILHTIEALEDCHWFCIHATDETEVSKVDEVLIQRK